MPGVGISIVIFAIGAILNYAVTANTAQHGFDINRVGVILMIVGAIGLVLSLIFWWATRQGNWYGPRRHRTVVDDDRGNVIRREDSYQ